MWYETKKHVGTLLGDNGLHAVLEMFAQMIQSGKNVFVDQNTRLKVYTFAPPEPVGTHTRFFTAEMSTFLKSSKSVVEIKNDKNNMCFSFTYVLGLAHLKEDQSFYIKLRKNNSGKATNSSQWTQLAEGLHTDILGLDVQSMVTWREFRLLEQYQPVGIHIYDISGVKHHFTFTHL